MNTKNIAPVLAGLLIAIGAGVLTAYAVETSYAPLAPLPIGVGGAVPSEYTMSSYLSGMIKLLIALGAATAILFAIIGGTQYVAAGIAPSAKQDAKNRIMNAFIGLTLMLVSYLLLNSINPNLVNFKLELAGVHPEPTAVSEMKAWPDDSVIRSELTSANIGINKENCEDVNDTKCTSVAGLPRQAIDGLLALKYACQSLFNNCMVQVTGGTEAGHQTHGIGIPVVDLSTANTTLNNFIETHAPEGKKDLGSCGVYKAPHYFVKGSETTWFGLGTTLTYAGTYVRESSGGDHWHVCY